LVFNFYPSKAIIGPPFKTTKHVSFFVSSSFFLRIPNVHFSNFLNRMQVYCLFCLFSVLDLKVHFPFLLQNRKSVVTIVIYKRRAGRWQPRHRPRTGGRCRPDPWNTGTMYNSINIFPRLVFFSKSYKLREYFPYFVQSCEITICNTCIFYKRWCIFTFSLFVSRRHTV